MTDRKALYDGLSSAAWGYLLIHFDFNLGSVSILPAFMGYLMLLSAIDNMSKERQDLALLRPLCVLLIAWNGLGWGLSWMGVDLDVVEVLAPLKVIVIVANMYVHFQFLTDMAALAEQYQPEGGNLDRRLLRRRTVYIVLVTVTNVSLSVPTERFIEQWAIAALALGFAMVVTALFLMAGLFELRRLFREEKAEQPDV